MSPRNGILGFYSLLLPPDFYLVCPDFFFWEGNYNANTLQGARNTMRVHFIFHFGATHFLQKKDTNNINEFLAPSFFPFESLQY